MILLEFLIQSAHDVTHTSCGVMLTLMVLTLLALRAACIILEYLNVITRGILFKVVLF